MRLILRDSWGELANWVDFAQFAVKFGVLPMGTGNHWKLARIMLISRDSWGELANWADFVQFAVKFGVSISHRANQKMVGEFHVICQKYGLFDYLGGIHGYLNSIIDANGMDFVSFII